MLKPFYNKKKNIDDRLVPAVSAADAGKFLGVTEEGKIALVEGGGGGSQLYLHEIGRKNYRSETRLKIITSNPEPMTVQDVISYINDHYDGFYGVANYTYYMYGIIVPHSIQSYGSETGTQAYSALLFEYSGGFIVRSGTELHLFNLKGGAKLYPNGTLPSQNSNELAVDPVSTVITDSVLEDKVTLL